MDSPRDHNLLLRTLVTALENQILQMTRQGVLQGNKIFGPALLKKSALSVVLAETNNETENPLWHGEVLALKRFFSSSRHWEGLPPRI